MILYRSLLIVAAFAYLSACTGSDAPAEDAERLAFIEASEASAFPGYSFQGEYAGTASLSGSEEPSNAGLQLALFGENRFRGMLTIGGLPGVGSIRERVEFEGYYDSPVLHLEALDRPLTLRLVDDRITLLDETKSYLGHFESVQRTSPVAGLAPPEDAVRLFSGAESDLQQWQEGAAMENGLLIQGARTRANYGDMRLHLEAKVGLMPNASSQRRTNSGIYIQNKYEVQILDSFALPVEMNTNGSLYNVHAPLLNMTYPPLRWQTYDVWFRAARFDDQGNKSENARITVYLNGVLVIDDGELEHGTGGASEMEEVPVDGFYLQDHTGPARFRNIWLVEGDYSPPGTSRLAP